jgi:Beta-lactamase
MDGDPIYDLHQNFTEDELIRKFASQSLKYPPGEKWFYCNTDYVILGVLIHRVTGKFWSDFVQERIFTPLGMSSTRPINADDVIPNRVNGYQITNGHWKNEPWIAPSFYTTADGTLYTNVLDMAKWDAALRTEKLLKRSTLEQMWTPVKLNYQPPYNYGFGWFKSDVNGHRLIWHDGVDFAFTTMFYRLVDDGLSIVVLINLGEDDAAAMPKRIADNVAAIYLPALGKAQEQDRSPSNATKLNLPGPDVQNLMLGTWSLKAQSTPAEKYLGDGVGTELWYAGPGGNSVIEELHLRNTKGQPIDAFGPAWWDPQAKGQRFIWGTNTLPEGCVISNGVMGWDGDRYVYGENDQEEGKNIKRREVFSDITANSFTQTISVGLVGKNHTPTWTALATRSSTESAHLAFPAAPIAGNAVDQPRAQVQKLINAFTGTWGSRDLSVPPACVVAYSGAP